MRERGNNESSVGMLTCQSIGKKSIHQVKNRLFKKEVYTQNGPKYSLKAHVVVRTLTIHVGDLPQNSGAHHVDEAGGLFTIAGDGLYAEG
jgi:hypothetical protein